MVRRLTTLTVITIPLSNRETDRRVRLSTPKASEAIHIGKYPSIRAEIPAAIAPAKECTGAEAAMPASQEHGAQEVAQTGRPAGAPCFRFGRLENQGPHSFSVSPMTTGRPFS